MDRNIYHNVHENLSIAPTNESAQGDWAVGRTITPV